MLSVGGSQAEVDLSMAEAVMDEEEYGAETGYEEVWEAARGGLDTRRHRLCTIWLGRRQPSLGYWRNTSFQAGGSRVRELLALQLARAVYKRVEMAING